MGNQLISFRLSPELVGAIAQRYPGKSPSEGAKLLILEMLQGASPEGKKRPDYIDIIDIRTRLDLLEAKVFCSNDYISDDTLMTPNNMNENDLSSPDDTLQTPEPISIVADDTLMTPVDIREKIEQLLAANPGVSSLRGVVQLLRGNMIKIPGKRGLALPTVTAIKPYLPEWWVKE